MTSTRDEGNKMACTSNGTLIDEEVDQGTHMDQEFANPTPELTRMPDLPYDIIVQILSRVPAKSLVRFRCVCNSWLSLTSDKKFIKNHLRMTTTNGNFSGHRLIFRNGGEKEFSCKSCSLDSIYSDLHINPITLDHTITIKEIFRYGSIVGSCDGLVCIRNFSKIYLWNPILRESRRLPGLTIDLVYAYLEPYSVYGFGYDSSIEDYKVVAVSFSSEDHKYLNQVDVYTLRSNSWRRIEPIPRGRSASTCGIFVNGALHWPLALPSNTWSIIALDLATETYHEIAQPTSADAYYNRMLGVLGGCLCLMMAENRIGKNIDVWIMKEYGMENSWTKLTSFPNLVDRAGNMKNYPHNTPLFVSEIGEMLVVYKSAINLYNLKDNTCRSPVIRHSFDCCVNFAIYVESLVSLGVDEDGPS